jgi:tRNA(Ile)-lysidine synthase
MLTGSGIFENGVYINSASVRLLGAVSSLDLAPATRILVAVSGGPDSIALLDALVRCNDELGSPWSLRVGHVNHGMRGDESNKDEQFTREEAERRSLPIDIAHVDTGAHAREQGLSLEAAARHLRYDALRSMLRAWNGDVIATGHTLDDQAETVLMRLLRGSGIVGLGGMHERGQDIIRPFLTVDRETIMQALQEQGRGYRLDSSNLDVRHLRNRLRRDLMPVLRNIQPRTAEILGRTAARFQLDADYLRHSAEQALNALEVYRDRDEISASRPAWLALHPSLQRLTFRLLVESMLGSIADIEESHVLRSTDAIQHTQRDLLHLPHSLTLTTDPDRFTLRRTQRDPTSALKPMGLPVPGRAILLTGEITAHLHDDWTPDEVARYIAVCGPLHALCDTDRLGSTLTVRSRRPGDRIRPFGLRGTRKIQDVLVDSKVPLSRRDTLPVVENGKHLVWIPGICLDDRVAITPETARVAHLIYSAGPRSNLRTEPPSSPDHTVSVASFLTEH